MPLPASEERNIHGRLSLPHTLLDGHAELCQGCAGDYQLGPVVANYLRTAHSSEGAMEGQPAVVTALKALHVFLLARCKYDLEAIFL